ncbi:MAG: DUF192 domain-containing protein [Candidatus Thiodiazotropha sp. (ex Myrtea sp. 'scaly one' KF741663)]|nr:DUF192 domain-containing protein [Candidatus Thiodiazotropha sp. (ex Myrtea sp. 'scaly one' KF741663)]
MDRVTVLIIRRDTDEKKVLSRVGYAKTFTQRLRGLIGRKHLADDEGLLFESGGSIHTIGMKISIDVIFLDKDGYILTVKDSVRPFRFCIAPKKTRYVLESSSGMAICHGVKSGQRLQWMIESSE